MSEPMIYASLSLEEIMTRLESREDTLVIAHVRPDVDALGSAFALKRLLAAMGSRVYCACGNEIPARLRFLIEDAEEAQESTLVNDLPPDFHPTRILAVDTASPAQMGDLYELYRGRIDLMIDHHARGERYADGWVDGHMAAAGEMIFDLSRALVHTGRLAAIPNGVDRLLYAAISSDTGCFRYSNVTPQTHMRAAELIRAAAGAFDPADINHRLFEVKSAQLLLAERLAFDRLHLLADGRIGMVDFPFDIKQKHHLKEEHLETLVDIPRGMEGVEVAVAIRQPAEAGVYRVSMRSACATDVAAVCATFGGGGHTRAAGCTITCDGGMNEVIDRVARALAAAMDCDLKELS